MINFVTALPPVLEPNSIYYVEGASGNAEHIVSDSEGNAVSVSSELLVQTYMASLKGQSNGYAELDNDKTVPVLQMPTGSKPAEISSAISVAESSLQSNINAKADASAVYEKAHVDTLESNLQGQVDAKQTGLANAADVAKLGDATFDGKPIMLLTATEW